jgi:hypothetical protein
VPTAVWINPPVNDVDQSRAETAHEVAIVDPGASCGAVLAANRPESPDLIPEDLAWPLSELTKRVSQSR